MPDNEDKKNLFSVDVVKKTEKVLEKKESEIGVEADIPIEDDGYISYENLSSNLKPNESISQPPKNEAQKSSSLEIKEKKFQVFNISSGKVIEKDLDQEEKLPEETFINKMEAKNIKTESPSNVNKDIRSAVRTPEGREFNKMPLLILGGILVLIILLYFVFNKAICMESKSEQNISPVINYNK